MQEVKLIILTGAYAQKYYLGKDSKKDLTENVHDYKDFLTKYFPLVHPSPLNFRRQAKNPWFKKNVLHALKKVVKKVLT